MRYHSMANKKSFISRSNSKEKYLVYDETNEREKGECPFFCYEPKNHYYIGEKQLNSKSW